MLGTHLLPYFRHFFKDPFRKAAQLCYAVSGALFRPDRQDRFSSES
jgi:hypothetical protein